MSRPRHSLHRRQVKCMLGSTPRLFACHRRQVLSMAQGATGKRQARGVDERAAWTAASRPRRSSSSTMDGRWLHGYMFRVPSRQDGALAWLRDVGENISAPPFTPPRQACVRVTRDMRTSPPRP